MTNATVVLYHWDQHSRGFYQRRIQDTLRELGIRGAAHGMDESYLERGILANGHLLPSRAVVLTHGNVPAQHQNVGFVRRLASEREDLQFIISLDEDELVPGRFDNRNDWDYVREKLGEEFTPAHQVTLVCDVIPTFLGGHHHPDRSFKKYMTLWKRLRGSP